MYVWRRQEDFPTMCPIKIKINGTGYYGLGIRITFWNRENCNFKRKVNSQIYLLSLLVSYLNLLKEVIIPEGKR